MAAQGLYFDSSWTEKIVLKDDWSGKSASERRKIQNRINSRAYRECDLQSTCPVSQGLMIKADSYIGKRKSLTLQQFDGSHIGNGLPRSSSCREVHDFVACPALNAYGAVSQRSMLSPSSTVVAATEAFTFLKTLRDVLLNSTIPPDKIQEFLCNVNTRIQYLLQPRHSPTADLLLRVVSHNVFRAFIINLGIIGYNPLTLANDDSVSPFSCGMPGKSLPPDLEPTTIQKSIPHHPVYDIFPDAQLRDLIILGERPLDHDLCRDIVGWSEEGHESGLRVWGEPYLKENWEATEEFLRRQRPFTKQLTQLIASSHRWREKRGEKPLVIGNLYEKS